MANIISFPVRRHSAPASTGVRFSSEQRAALCSVAGATLGRLVAAFETGDGGGDICFLVPGAGRAGPAVASVGADAGGWVLMDGRGDPIATSHDLAVIVGVLELLVGVGTSRGVGGRDCAS